MHYISTNLPGNVQVSATHTDFMKRFIECFSEHFETEFTRRRQSHQKINGTVNTIEEEDIEQISHIDVAKPSKPFFRRLSFKGLKKGKVCTGKWHAFDINHDQMIKTSQSSIDFYLIIFSVLSGCMLFDFGYVSWNSIT